MNTFLKDENGNSLGDCDFFIPNLFEGMDITIHGNGAFVVVSWNFHHGHDDEEAGLRIVLGPKY